MSGSTVAAFDFDGTLTDRDSVVPFLRRVGGTAALASRLLVRTHQVAPLVLRRERDRLKELASAHAFRSRPVVEIEPIAIAHAAELVERRLRSDTIACLRRHQDLGHRVVIVSAAYEMYLQEVGRRLGVDAVLATRLEADGGVLTGRLNGANCRGAEKVRRLDEWLAGAGLARDEITLHAYGDSSGDQELLAVADHPVWVTGAVGSVSPTA